MQYFKKFPIFVSIITLLLLAFVAGAVYDATIFFSECKKSEKKLKNARLGFEDAIAQDPSQKSIDSAKANIKQLEERLAFLEKDLTRAHGDIFTPAPAEPYQLVEHLRGKVQSWKRTAIKKGISIASGMDFGYKRYVEPSAEPPVEAAVSPIWKQACVLDYINKKLFDCKTEQSPMAIVSVQREVLQAEGAKKTANNNKKLSRRERMALARQASKNDNKGDNFVIDPNITARKPGSLDTIAFRFTFAGHTDILRRFLNKLKDFDAMLVVRSIDVKPADSNVNDILKRKVDDVELEGLDDIFGTSKKKDNAEQQAPSEEEQKIKTPVVTDNLSEFSVVIEYVEVVKEPEVKKTKNKEQ
ncbi:MAG: hypothetical protein E7035_10095 [Verrucomicrobiaceae bacterium]|nr:hypothetical protein [Verrucomicrobiaceae bacterium]